MMKYLFAPFICAIIGWLTNYIAVKMLFHPQKPVYVLGYPIQGVFPKRQGALAERLGEVIENELVSARDVADHLSDNGALHAKFGAQIDQHVEGFLKEKLVGAIPMAAMFMNDDMIKKIKDVLVPEIEAMVPVVMETACSEIENQFNVKQLVREKVEAFSTDKLEEILFGIMSNEFRFIELVGGVLGFAIGCFQSLLFHFMA